jgi:hypothetical protein
MAGGVIRSNARYTGVRHGPDGQTSASGNASVSIHPVH